MFHALAKAPNPDVDHEAAYMAVVDRCHRAGAPDVVISAKALFDATLVGVHRGQDFLGSVAAEIGSLERGWGQFFTPMDVCRLTAALMIDESSARDWIASNGCVSVHEPAAGSGAMLLAVADRLASFEVDVQRQLYFEAWELDPGAARMCFVQLALRGVPARVALGNTLTQDVREIWATPKIWRVAERAQGVAIAAQ